MKNLLENWLRKLGQFISGGRAIPDRLAKAGAYVREKIAGHVRAAVCLGLVAFMLATGLWGRQ